MKELTMVRARRIAVSTAIGAVVATLLLPGPAAQAVTGGTPVAAGADTFVASVHRGEVSCSGVLVAPEWVLTLSACLGDDIAAGPVDGATATVGRTDLTTDTGLRTPITHLSPHPTLGVVLARLATPATGIAPVPLGGAPVAGETLRIAGYGRTDSAWVPDHLRAAPVTVGAVAAASFSITAAGGGPATCLGDAGGPALRDADGRTTLVGLHASGHQGGCLAVADTRREGTEIRADQLAPWLAQHVAVPQPTDEISANALSTANVTASSSAENWGWLLSEINDGVRDASGWTSWPSAPAHTETLEFTLARATTVNRVDLYPRLDQPAAQNNFPANFAVDVWTGSAWTTVASRSNVPRSLHAVRVPFPAVSTTKLRVRGLGVEIMQLNEVEAYHSANLAADAVFTASSSAENWGWLLSEINDGVRDASGWTSWPSAPAHTETLEMTFPAARDVNRVDLYPRTDQPAAQNNFPANFAVDVWTGSAWTTVASRSNVPRSLHAVRVPFPAVSTTKLRVRGLGVEIMQLNEVEAYHSANLAADAVFTASSSAENWGWSLPDINDGARDQNGWTSWPSAPSHTETLEMTFPAARDVNRVDLYPRTDLPAAQNNFPANVTVSAWTGTEWRPVVTRRGLPRTAEPARIAFPTVSTTKLRIAGTELELMQLSEVEAYAVQPVGYPAPTGAGTPSIVEAGDHPGAAEILAAHQLKVFKGDGHIVFDSARPYGRGGECAPGLLQVEKHLDDEPYGIFYCFRTIGSKGHLTLEVPGTFGVRGGSEAVTATAKLPNGTVLPPYEVDAGERVAVVPGTGEEPPRAILVELRMD
ncbi:S1 family peptidase [Jidongwangia harbinensis]|uniref:S1 family peptidase n=1 Tax=Jidongwangia harbinensis TaxID=2878561 RepID=UPI001CD91AD1|nr:discoidin domain-containing protein [Jidongwangia harbinensis]MCA2217633.1 discoidin domain-containing protein [Jidongwangia harbinensis]